MDAYGVFTSLNPAIEDLAVGHCRVLRHRTICAGGGRRGSLRIHKGLGQLKPRRLLFGFQRRELFEKRLNAARSYFCRERDLY